MPRRNLTIIFLASVLSIVCYGKAERNRYASVFADVMKEISEKYIEEVEPSELFKAAMRGMISEEVLDQYSYYIAPETFRRFQVEIDQEFGGVGIEVVIDPDSKRLTVMSPLAGTPAYRAGILAGDTILEIDGKSTEGFSLNDAVDLLRGKPEEPVSMTVLHAGEEEPETIEMVRAIILIKSILGDTRKKDGSWNYFLEENPRIGYIRITTFGEHTVEDLESALRQFKRHPVGGLILDLRNNPGGLLKGAIEVSDMFIDEGMIVSTRMRGGKIKEQYKAHQRNTIVGKETPLVVLVNRHSASASEIVAACLQDHKSRAVIIGERTWGKGSVQNVVPLEDGSALKLTTATFHRPSGDNIHRSKDATEEDAWGVAPHKDFEVKMSDEETVKVYLQRRDRDVVRTNGPPPSDDGKEKAELLDDPQLRRAIEFLESRFGRTDTTPDKG